MIYDVLVLGAGPAGFAAAISAKSRNRSVLVISNPWKENPLCKAEWVDNYLGIPKISGYNLMDSYQQHAEKWGIELIEDRVSFGMSFEGFSLTAGSENYQGRSLVLCTGVNRGAAYEGELEFLGKGVSYCATCDGFFYQNRPVTVLGLAHDAINDANFLQSLGCSVTFIAHRKPDKLNEEIAFQKMGKISIYGNDKVEGIRLNDAEIPCDGVFLLRNTLAPKALFPNLETESGYIKVNRKMETNIDGIYAAGDCTGLPLQIAKAVGEGHIAGISASEWLEQAN